MTEMQNPSADNTARGAPKGLRWTTKDFRVPRRRHPAQAAIAKTRRRIRPETWSSLNAAVAREHQALTATQPNSPRIRPTLAPLRWLEQSALGNGVEVAA
jgi:hypothetical protein